MRLSFFSHVVMVVLSLAASLAHAVEVKTVERVDLDRYQGKWHEIASIPQFFQRDCARDTVAEYTKLDSGDIKVENTCLREDSGRKKAEGRARVNNIADTAKLSVTFLNLFGDYRFWAGGDYWVIELDPNYQWAVIGHPSRKYGWVLSRNASVPMATIAEIIGRIKAQGYDACEFLVTPQNGGLSLKRPLCQVIQ
jgi:apolipoprotein D and lipocalin family protein